MGEGQRDKVYDRAGVEQGQCFGRRGALAAMLGHTYYPLLTIQLIQKRAEGSLHPESQMIPNDSR